jgi:hypothetical protein
MYLCSVTLSSLVGGCRAGTELVVAKPPLDRLHRRRSNDAVARKRNLATAQPELHYLSRSLSERL